MLNAATTIYSGVDVSSIDKVTSQLLNKSASNQKEEVVVSEIDYSKFNRATLGVDLYSSRTSVDLQKQIALTQSGLYVQSVDVSNLNSAAAASLYSASTVQKNVELTQSTLINEIGELNETENSVDVVETTAINDKNANSSNSFNPFNSENEEAREEEG